MKLWVVASGLVQPFATQSTHAASALHAAAWLQQLFLRAVWHGVSEACGVQFAAPPLELPELLLAQPASPAAVHIPPLLVPPPPLEHATIASQRPGVHPIAICFHLSISASSSWARDAHNSTPIDVRIDHDTRNSPQIARRGAKKSKSHHPPEVLPLEAMSFGRGRGCLDNAGDDPQRMLALMGPAPASDLGRVGQLVGSKFRLDAVIGRGAMGTIWAATHVNLGHRVAIKLVAREFVRSPEVLRRFDAEAKAAARLQSRHVVQVFDSGALDDGTPYIAMELLAGENLEQRVRRSGPMSSDQAIQTLAQCCKALARAHAAGIVHRDIKPENVFLARAPDEDVDVAKILDFGVAKITMELDGRTSATGTGALLGTPIYMSPEQVRGAKEIDHRTDIYSLGLVAFTIMTGKLAIDGETFGEVVLKICAHPLPSLCSLAPHLPAAMDVWFHRACAREAVDRHQSAQEFIDTLRAAAGEPALREARVRPVPPTPSTLLSAGGAEGAGAGSTGPFLGQTGASVSVTAAVASGPSGVPRVRPAAVLAGVLSAAMLIATGAIWFAFSLHGGRASSGSADETDSRSPVIASVSMSVAPTPPSATIEPVDAASPVHTHASVTARASVPPPPLLIWGRGGLPPPPSARPQPAAAHAPPNTASANPLGY